MLWYAVVCMVAAMHVNIRILNAAYLWCGAQAVFLRDGREGKWWNNLSRPRHSQALGLGTRLGILVC